MRDKFLIIKISDWKVAANKGEGQGGAIAEVFQPRIKEYSMDARLPISGITGQVMSPLCRRVLPFNRAYGEFNRTTKDRRDYGREQIHDRGQKPLLLEFYG